MCRRSALPDPDVDGSAATDEGDAARGRSRPRPRPALVLGDRQIWPGGPGHQQVRNNINSGVTADRQMYNWLGGLVECDIGRSEII